MPGFKDIVGHKEAIQHLESAMKLDKVSHAYIINGEKGSGKSCWLLLLPRCCSVKGKRKIPVGNADPADRLRAEITLIL